MRSGLAFIHRIRAAIRLWVHLVATGIRRWGSFLEELVSGKKRGEINPWLHRFAVLTALASLGLIGVGGLVTSHGAGMAVPDWPTSYGYNMFLFPFAKWWRAGNVFYEHSHRLFASGVGLLTTVLMVWLWLKESRRWLRWLGVAAFIGVVLQGVLGGLRVVLLADKIGIFHATIAQLFLVLTSAIALVTSTWWLRFVRVITEERRPNPLSVPDPIRRLFVIITLVILAQLMVAATIRHQHAGLAIPDFPLAYGKVWPGVSPDAILRYNQRRMEVTEANPITAFQIELQMVHRLLAIAIMSLVAWSSWQTRKKLGSKHPLSKAAAFWLGLICIQIGLGAWTIWSNKAADIATVHVLVGALALVTGSLMSIVAVAGGRPQQAPVTILASSPEPSWSDSSRSNPIRHAPVTP